MTLIRVSSADWGQLYLMEERGLSTYNAGGFGTALECGGVFGTTVIGAMADFAIKKVGRFSIVNVAFWLSIFSLIKSRLEILHRNTVNFQNVHICIYRTTCFLT